MKTISQISHDIKHRENPKDEFYTPVELAKYTISMVDLKPGNIVLDSAYGTGNYFNNYPSYTENKYTTDFFNFNEEVDWIITNPPYSKLDDYLKHSAEICKKGFAYLLNHDAITPRRLEYLEQMGFYVTRQHMCNVFKWYGISEFVIFEKDVGSGLIDYDRKIWRDSENTIAAKNKFDDELKDWLQKSVQAYEEREKLGPGYELTDVMKIEVSVKRQILRKIEELEGRKENES